MTARAAASKPVFSTPTGPYSTVTPRHGACRRAWGARARDFGAMAGEAARIYLASQPYGPLRGLCAGYGGCPRLCACGIRPLLSPLREKILSLFTSLAAYPDAASCLMALKTRRPPGILSNGSPAMLAAAVASAKLGALLDYVISVDAVRIYKPSPEV